MPITVGSTGLRLTTENRGQIPNVVKTALAAPVCVQIASSGTGEGGSMLIELLTGTAAYMGFSFMPAVAAGEQAPLANGAIVEGFAGCTQGGLVYPVDADGTLSHTSNGAAIGRALSATKIYFYLR